MEKEEGINMNRAILQKNTILTNATQHWKYVAPLLTYPKNESEYDLLVQRLDLLLEIVGDNENHHLIGLVDAISKLISAYDEENFKVSVTGIKALHYLMDLRQLNQSDLHEIGSQGVVSEILNGKRKLNIRQMKILSKLFNVDISTFVDEE